MKKLFIALMLFFACNTLAQAQNILPKDLFQIWRFWKLNTPHYDRNTYEYIQTVDQQWKLRLDPQKDTTGFTILLGCWKNNAWYKDEEYRLMLSCDSKQSKNLIYQFTDADNWKSYNAQMYLMEAIPMKTVHLNGGTQAHYKVNDIYISLNEYPPGIIGDDRVYQVQILQK